nr:immunoglobulin light chain junction region [Macaca mulatta]MOX37620.1 immunoglobulin light chain junction region [Macaca mulatta]
DYHCQSADSSGNHNWVF